MLDFPSLDAFSLASLTAAFLNQDYIPGRAGEVVFAGVAQGLNTTTAVFEMQDQALSLIESTARNAPAPQNVRDLRKMNAVVIPQIKLEETVPVAGFQNVRAFGSNDQLIGPMTVVNQEMAKHGARHDLTLEHLRLGALQGIVYDADGSTVLCNLFDTFGVVAQSAVNFTDVVVGTDATVGALRGKITDVIRSIVTAAKTVWPSSAQIYAFCGDDFYDAIVTAAGEQAYKFGMTAADRLSEAVAYRSFAFGGVVWENYRGTDDGSTVAIAAKDCRLFPVGVPGLYAEYYAPADFGETVNTIGLPRYAKLAADEKFNRAYYLHTQSNPLPICTRPRTLLRGYIS